MPKEGKINPRITQEVFDEYEKLRMGGSVNMLDTNAVYTEAGKRRFVNLMTLIGNNVRDYLEIMTRYKFYSGKYKRKR